MASTTRQRTAEDILDVAEALIQSRGYSAFSYQHIADELGIRKASIHYHFPSKSDLGLAVVNRYAERFGAALATIAADPNASSMSMLEQYVAPFQTLASTPDKVCLCGALAGEMPALPPELRARVALFFREHHKWLAEILTRGVASGEFVLSSDPQKTARLMFGALQGALLVKRTTDDASQLADVVAALRTQVSAPVRPALST